MSSQWIDIPSLSGGGGGGGAVDSVNGQTGVVVISNVDIGLGNVTNNAQLKIASNLSDLNNAATARTNIGLGNVDNTSDANKPVSTATQTALNLKQDSLGYTPLNPANNLSDVNSASTSRTNLGLGTVATLNQAAVLLSANNLSDLASASTARTNIGLGNVNNTSDANKPVSTAQQAALDLKLDLTGGTVTGPITYSSENDQWIYTNDVDKLRGGNRQTASGTLYTLVGNTVMNYVSHNVALSAAGDFLGRDATETCGLRVWTDANLIQYYNAPSDTAGVVPTFTKTYELDIATGMIKTGSAQAGIIGLSANPITGSGQSAPVGSIAMNTATGGNAIFVKNGSGDNDWATAPVASAPTMYSEVQEFIGGNTANGWAQAGSSAHSTGAGAYTYFPANNTSDTSSIGVISLGTTAANAYHAVSASTTNTLGLLNLNSKTIIVNVRFKLPQVPDNTVNNFAVSFGFGNSFAAATADHANGFYFFADQANANWQCKTANASTRTTTSSGVALDTNWNNFKIIANTTSVKFYINGTLVATNTTNIPSSNASSPTVNFGAYTTNYTATKYVYADFLNYTVILDSAR